MSITKQFFSPDGPLAAHFEEYEMRDAQIRMAVQVEQIIEKKGVLLAEAGTGTGKTLAYLVPTMLMGRTAIISTGTKNLQEQIFFKDIEMLNSILETPINAVYLKGQENYLCLRRLDELRRSPRVLSFPPERVAELNHWAQQTQTGDRMEIDGLADDDPLWGEVCSTRESRIGPRCKQFNNCFVTRARKQAMQAQLVVVNHHLYFADLATRLQGGSILPEHGVVVFDEAHSVEDVATEFFSVAVSSSRVKRLLDDTPKIIRSAKFGDDPAEERRKKMISAAQQANTGLFFRFRGSAGRAKLIPEEIDDRCHEAYHRLDTSLDAVENSIRALEGTDDVVDHLSDRFAALRSDLDQVLSRSARGFVHWVENRRRSAVLGASPIDVSDQLREGIFFAIPSVIMTSATLCTDRDFSFLKSRLGIDFEATELSVDSPFDYSRQGCLFLPSQIADPRDERFVDQAAETARTLIEITDGGALVLCTSLRNMKALHERLCDTVDGPVLLQGEAPKSSLLTRFKTHRQSVLCATASFWQGVDLPGEALRLVIIDKLPFASPTDPLVSARIDHIEQQGQNPFVHYQLPHAVLSLKQGFGRLIRTRGDRGIVAILDQRLRTKSYAKTFLRSLPDCPVLSQFDEVESWWRTPQARINPVSPETA